MREFDLPKSVLEAALAQAEQIGARRVLSLNLVLCDDWQFDFSQFSQHFARLAQGTLVEGAHLNMEYRASERHCWSCDTVFMGHSWDASCPQCGSPGRLMTSADQAVMLDSIEIQVAVPPTSMTDKHPIHASTSPSHTFRSLAHARSNKLRDPASKTSPTRNKAGEQAL